MTTQGFRKRIVLPFQKSERCEVVRLQTLASEAIRAKSSSKLNGA